MNRGKQKEMSSMWLSNTPLRRTPVLRWVHLSEEGYWRYSWPHRFKKFSFTPWLVYFRGRGHSTNQIGGLCTPHAGGGGKENTPVGPRSGWGWSNGVHSWTRHRTSGVIMIMIMSARWCPRSVKYRTREPVSLLYGGCLLVRVITVRPQTIDIAISYIDIP